MRKSFHLNAIWASKQLINSFYQNQGLSTIMSIQALTSISSEVKLILVNNFIFHWL